MDPLAHTLLGAALAETGLKRLAPRAATALVIGANLPDIDAATVLLGSDASLLLRRGWTHGPLGLLLLPGLLVAGILALDRGRWRQAADRAGPPHAARLLGLAWLGALTHPALDWTRPGPRESLPPRERREPDAAVQGALGSGTLAGFRNWLRLPDWEVRPEGDGVRVILRDLRYARDDEAGFGVASVLLDAAGRPRP